MDGFEIFGLNLPFFVVITILFAYIIWSKFLKKNKLKIQNINDLLDIFCLSVVLLIFISGSIILISIFFRLLSLNNVNTDLIFQQVQFLIPIIIVPFILMLIAKYRKRRPTRNELRTIVIEIIGVYFILMVSFIGFWLLIFFTALKSVLKDMVILLPLMVVLIIICYWIVNRSLFKIKIKEDILSSDFLKAGLAVVILVILITFFLIPIVKDQEKISVGYHLYDVYYDNGPRYGYAYLEISVPIDIVTFGILGSRLPYIPINYGKYDMNTEGAAGANFNILINKSDEKNTQILISTFENVRNYNQMTDKKYGINSVFLDENEKTMALKYDYKIIKRLNINKIFFKGYVKKNLTEIDYSYITNRIDPICDGKRCILIINVTNNMNVPIHQHRDVIFNLNGKNIINKSECKFENISSNFPKDKKKGWTMRNSECNSYSCSFEIYDFENKKELFSFYIVKDADTIELHTIDAFVPIKVNIEVEIEC